MIIFVEGVDGSGKTTLVNTLEKSGYKKMDAIDRTLQGQYWEWNCLKDKVKFSRKPAIVDRSFISELVYRLFDDDVPTIDLQSISFLLENDVKIIYCKNKNSYSNAISRGEYKITDKDIHKKIENAYDVVMSIIEKFTRCPIFKYDFDDDSISEVIKFINR